MGQLEQDARTPEEKAIDDELAGYVKVWQAVGEHIDGLRKARRELKQGPTLEETRQAADSEIARSLAMQHKVMEPKA